MISKIRHTKLNIRKYTISELKFLSKLPEYKSARKYIKQALPKLKIEKQWWDIRAKFGYQIPKHEFVEYYHEVRKAQRKLNRIKMDEDLLLRTRLPMGVTWIRTPKQLRLQRGRIKRILSRNYKSELASWVREQLYQNIQLSFGYNESSNQLIEEFKSMTDAEINKFFKKNPVLDRLLYESKNDKLQEYLDRGSIDSDIVQTAIEDFAKKEGLESVIIKPII